MDQSDVFRASRDTAATQDELWLLGQPPLQKLLDYVEDMTIDGTAQDRASLINEWRSANDYCELLEKQEAGIANGVDCRDIDPALAPLVEEVMADPRYRCTFDSLPTHIAMVELDRLVLCQNHVTRNFVDALKLRLGPAPGPQAVFRLCLPLDQPETQLQVRRTGSKRFLFRSDSTDVRFHEAVLLRPDQISGYDASGAVAGVVGIVVGFSCNFLNAICDDDSGRLVLHNGYHRACALRELGITHAPCVIQTVTRRDELDVIAKSIVANDPGYFFNSPRPPMLKDFYDPRIAKTFRVGKLVRTIEVNFEIRDTLVPE